MRGFKVIETSIRDLRYSLRMMGKAPGFTFIAILTLALGIGANTAIFSIVNAVLLKPLPYPDSQRLAWISEVSQGAEFNDAADYIHFQKQSKTFDHLAAFESGQIYLTGSGESERLDSVMATSTLFPVLGVAPQLGRAFTPDEDRPGGAPVVILSHVFWQRRFGGTPDVIGRLLTLNGKNRQVIGVMPPDFNFIHKTDVLLPLAIDSQSVLLSNSQGGVSILSNIIGRLKPGVSVKQAQSELNSILQRLKQDNPKRFLIERVTATLLAERLFGNLKLGLLTQFGAMGGILLIACANVANMLLARANVRQKEMAIRAALGASRGQLARQILTESLVLSVFGGLAGLFLALMGVKALAPLIPENLAHLKGSGIDNATLGFTFLASLLTGTISGIIPAMQASRIDPNDGLKDGVRSLVFSRRHGMRRVSPALVVSELTLALMLLIGSGLLIRSYLKVQAVDPGFNPKNLLTMTIPLRPAGYPVEQWKNIYQDILTRLNNLPGVLVAAMGPVPLTETREAADGKSAYEFMITPKTVSHNYFRAMGMQLRSGRSFTELDTKNSLPVVIINEAQLRSRFHSEDPVGKPIDFLGVKMTIVGVVTDVKNYGLETNADNVMYRVLSQADSGISTLVVRTSGDPSNLVPAVREQIRSINAHIPVVDVMSMEQRLAGSLAPRRFRMRLFGIFAALALLIALVGIYGVISYAVSQRTHEIGIRMALGAQSTDVLRMVIWQGMILTLIGVALGLAAALALTRVMKNLLFNVSATDPVTFALIASLLIGVGMIASYIPARRATKVDPLKALRHE